MPKDLGERGEDDAAAPSAPAASAAPGRRPLTTLAFPPRLDAGAAAGGLDLRLPEPSAVSAEIDEFRAALDRSDRDAAQWAWMRASPSDREAWGRSPSIGMELQAARRTLGVGMVGVMAQAGIDFDGRDSLVRDIIAGPYLGQYVDAMFHQSDAMAASFLSHLPHHGELTAAHKKALGRIVTGANSTDAARFAFGRLWGGSPIDASYTPDTLRTRPWTQEALERVHGILITHGGQEHIRSVTGWFIGTEYKDDAGDAAFKPLGFAWYQGGKVVLPDDSVATGGGTTHSMVGGASAHTDRGAKTKAGAVGTLSHLQVSVLHEVGHGVGDQLGGNAWARSHPFVDWQTGMDADAWSAPLWGDDDALTAAARVKFPVEGMPSSRDVRVYLATSLRGDPVRPPGWDRTRIEALVDNCYADQKLTKYWKWAMGDRDGSFKFAGTGNYGHDDRVYVWLSRGGSGLASYTQAAHKDKVSWYSLSSPNEWFAEQYVAYYHHEPRGTGLDAGAKTKLDELHRTAAPTDDPGELLRPDFGGEAAGATAATDDRATAAPAARPPSSDRVPMPW
jgi:hypothetical protein